MPLIYGEGKEKALRRLREEIGKNSSCKDLWASTLFTLIQICPVIEGYPRSSQLASWTASVQRDASFVDRTSPYAGEIMFEPVEKPTLSKEQQNTLIEYLLFHAIDSRYLTVKAAHAKTCRWLLQEPKYKDWLDASKVLSYHGLLWIKGKPGSGKSTLMKFIVTDTRKRKVADLVISFFFNARGEELEKSTLGMY